MNQPPQNKIDDILNWCSEAEENGTTEYPGMTYEQGVNAAIRWMQGEGEDPGPE